jgi:hypothetical protein
MVSDEVGGLGNHGRAELAPLGEGRPGDVSEYMTCDGISRAGRGVCHVCHRVCVQSNGPRPPWQQHRGGTPSWCSARICAEKSGRPQQRDDAASAGEDRTPHRGGSDGVSCSFALEEF